MALPNNPITRKEMYLSNMAGQGTALPDEPITREEEYLDYIAKNGGGGTGEGDMKKSVYDSDLDVSGAGGIKAFVNGQTNDLQPKTLDTPITIGGVSRTTVEAALGALEDSKEDTILAATPLVKEYDEIMRQDVLRLTMDDTPTASSNNPVKSGGVKSAVSATVDLLKDTTGWLGGNKLKTGIGASGSIGDGTWNINSDGSVTINATLSSIGIAPWRLATGGMNNGEVLTKSDIPHGTYKIIWVNANGQKNNNIRLQILGTNGALNQATEIANSYSNDTVTIDDTYAYYYARVWINNGTINDTMYGMLIDADEYALLPTYAPYHESVEEEIQDIYNFNAKTGVHQLIPTKLSYLKTRNTAGTWTGNSYTINGITYDISVDDNDNVTKIAVSGNSTAYSEFLFTDRTHKDLKLSSASNYKISLGHDSVRVTVGTGNSGDGSTGTYVVVGRSADNNEVEFSGIDKYVSISIDIPSGINISDSVDIYSLLRYAEDKSEVITPYAMTNRELTEKVFSKGIISSGDDLNNVTDEGIYTIVNTPTNSPENTNFCGMIVQKSPNGDIRQIIFKSGSAAGYMYIRSYSGNPLAWQPWFKFTGTVVS